MSSKAKSTVAAHDFKFSSIPPPIPALNAKNVSSTFGKNESNSAFALTRRKAEPDWLSERGESKRKQWQLYTEETGKAVKVSEASVEEVDSVEDGKPGNKTIVIHPGSTTLRIGLASDQAPLNIPFVVARPTPRARQFRTNKTNLYDPALDPKIDTMRVELRSRMRLHKLRGTTNGQQMAKEYNETVKPEVLPNDPQRVEWLDPASLGGRSLIGPDVGRQSLYRSRC